MSNIEVYISTEVIKKISERSTLECAKLIGIKRSDSIYVIAVLVKKNDIPGCEQITILNFPVGFVEVGQVFWKTLDKLEDSNESDINDGYVTLVANNEGTKCFVTVNNERMPIDYKSIDGSRLKDIFVYFRLDFAVPLSSKLRKSLQEPEFIENATSAISSFSIKSIDAEIKHNEKISISQFLASEKFKKMNVDEKDFSIQEVFLVQPNFLNDKNQEMADEDSENRWRTKFIVDEVVVAHTDSIVGDVYKMLMNAVVRRLREHDACDEKHACDVKLPCHFFPKVLGHMVTIYYPRDINDDDCAPSRMNYHEQLLLPCDKPYLRKFNRVTFERNEIINALANVHVNLQPPPVKGDMALVKGTYNYYHYSQGGVNDSGWGCAYRSLQTLYSWYRHEGWTDNSVPSIKKIQDVLVDIGDKPQSFRGSKQWIGSLEVSYVLDTLLCIPCRILSVAKGESIATYRYDIAQHFRKHGSPIMIGGGVLAHTILGVVIDDITDDCMFLVLDPHYTGAEDVSTIRKKKGIAWRAPDFWKKGEFYNLCLPQKKTGV